MSEGEMASIKAEMMKKSSSYIWIETADGSIQQVEEEVAMLCPVICQEVIQKKGVGSSKNYAIPLPEKVNSAMLSLIFDYCRFHKVPGRSNKELKMYDEKFTRMDTERLGELFLAADSLQLKPLVDLTCRALARIIEGETKTPQEKREIFQDDDLTEEEKLKPVKNTMNDPKIRLLNRLNAKKLKELKESEKLKSVAVEEEEEERSVDDLLSFINGRDDPKVVKKKTSKSKKKKNKQKNGTSTGGTCEEAEIVDKTESSNLGDVSSMEDVSFTPKTDFGDGDYIGDDDEIDPVWKEKVDREVEDFAKRLNLDEKYR